MAIAFDQLPVLGFADQARQAPRLVLHGRVPPQLAAGVEAMPAGGIVVVVEGGGVQFPLPQHLEDLLVLGVHGEHGFQARPLDAQLRRRHGIHLQVPVEGTVLVHEHGPGPPLCGLFTCFPRLGGSFGLGGLGRGLLLPRFFARGAAIRRGTGGQPQASQENGQDGRENEDGHGGKDSEPIAPRRFPGYRPAGSSA